jgi:hypothetical protein
MKPPRASQRLAPPELKAQLFQLQVRWQEPNAVRNRKYLLIIVVALMPGEMKVFPLVFRSFNSFTTCLLGEYSSLRSTFPKFFPLKTSTLVEYLCYAFAHALLTVLMAHKTMARKL